MKLEVEIDVDHAAYRMEDGSIDWNSVSNYLRRLANAVEFGIDNEQHKMFDINGNPSIKYGLVPDCYDVDEDEEENEEQ